MVGLLDDNSKNYIAVVQYLRKCHNAAVDEPIDSTITDTSYDPASTVKSIKQQQKILSEAEIRAVIQKYKAGASTYQLAEEFGCHRVTISSALKRNGIIVTHRKVDIPIAIQMYESGKTTTEIAKFFDTNGSAVSRTLRASGVKMRKRWEYPRNKKPVITSE
jgi:DNA invertase Pin-like site-specific DNA recombinase